MIDMDLGISRIKKQKVLPFFIPSRDNRCDIGTMQSLSNLSLYLAHTYQIQSIVFSANASNIPRSRNLCLRSFESKSDQIFCLWMDDDMIIQNDHFNYLISMMEYAFTMPRSTVVVANYRTAMENFRAQLMAKRTLDAENEIFMPEGEERFQDLGESGVSGLGLAIGWFPKNYVFHADEFGEDVYFWHDTKTRMVVDCGWLPGHRKELVL